jgi:hypothetical protein
VPVVHTPLDSTPPTFPSLHQDNETFKQAIEHLQTGLPSEAEINKIQAAIAKIIAKEKAIKKEGAESSAH